MKEAASSTGEMQEYPRPFLTLPDIGGRIRPDWLHPNEEGHRRRRKPSSINS